MNSTGHHSWVTIHPKLEDLVYRKNLYRKISEEPLSLRCANAAAIC